MAVKCDHVIRETLSVDDVELQSVPEDFRAGSMGNVQKSLAWQCY